jgi:REP-associated tyrosine transposase
VGRAKRDKHAGIFHIYTHGVWQAPPYFRDDVDRMVFLRELARATRKTEWRCIAFCLLATHYHLLLDVDDGALSEGMQSLNWRYAMQFNERHASRGHAQFDRFGSRRIEDDSDLLSACRYIVRNPVEAGLCVSPQDWPWSSYAGTVALAEQQSFVDASLILECLGGESEIATARLRRFVEGP